MPCVHHLSLQRHENPIPTPFLFWVSFSFFFFLSFFLSFVLTQRLFRLSHFPLSFPFYGYPRYGYRIPLERSASSQKSRAVPRLAPRSSFSSSSFFLSLVILSVLCTSSCLVLSCLVLSCRSCPSVARAVHRSLMNNNNNNNN